MSFEPIETACDVIRRSASVAAGMRELINAADRSSLLTPSQRALLDEIDFAAEAERLTEALRTELASATLKGVNGFYFGIDGLNMPDGKGIEFGCSALHEAGIREIQFAWKCEQYLDNLPSTALTQIYSLNEPIQTDAEYLICFGYLGLVLKQAFHSGLARLIHRPADEIAIAFGFHDGDLALLGFVRPNDLNLLVQLGDFDETNEQKRATADAAAFSVYCKDAMGDENLSADPEGSLIVRPHPFQPDEMADATFPIFLQMHDVMLFDRSSRDLLKRQTQFEIFDVFCAWNGQAAIGLRVPHLKNDSEVPSVEMFFRPFDPAELLGYPLAWIDGRNLVCTPAFRSAWIDSGSTGLHFAELHGQP